MSPEESPRDKYERIQRLVQESILSNYPNPARKGCPGSELIERLAQDSVAGDPHNDSDSDWHHMTHCSECYREYLAVRARVYRAKERKLNVVRWSIPGSIILVALSAFLFVRVRTSSELERPQNAELAYQPKTINVASMRRSADGKDANANGEILLNRGLIDLTVQLPIGSKAGPYEFRLRSGDRSTSLNKSAEASIFNGITSFGVKLDLRNQPLGRYSMEIRQSPFDWMNVPIRVQ